MSELKAYIGPAPDEKGLADYYLKSEADKVIAELKKERDWLAKDRAQAYDDLEKRAQLNIKQEESIRHSNHKRCLDMAECRDAQARLFHRFGTEVMLKQLYGRNPAVDMKQMDRRSSRCRLASQLWKKRAEKFKEAK